MTAKKATLLIATGIGLVIFSVFFARYAYRDCTIGAFYLGCRASWWITAIVLSSGAFSLLLSVFSIGVTLYINSEIRRRRLNRNAIEPEVLATPIFGYLYIKRV